MEMFARLGYLEGDYEGAFTADLGVVFNIGKRFGIPITYEWLDVDDQGVGLNLSQVQIGARINF